MIYKSKPYQILASFTLEQRNLFLNHLANPNFNTEKTILKFNQWLIQNWKICSSKNSNLLAFKAVYPNKQFNESSFYYLKSKSYSLLKQFLVLHYSNAAVFSNPAKVLETLRSLQLNHLYEIEERKIERQNNAQNLNTANGFLSTYYFDKERQEYYANLKRTETRFIDQMHYSLDAFYYIEKLKVACTSFNFQQLIKKEIKQPKIDGIITQIEADKLHEKIPLLAVYYYAYLMLFNESENSFLALKALIETNDFPNTEIKDAYLLAINFCIKQLNKGNATYNLEMFELYQTGLDKTYLLDNGNIAPITYSNMVTIGLRLKRFAEIQDFIEAYKRKIAGTNKSSYYHFNLSKYYFETGNFKKVTDLYYTSNVSELLLKIQVRIIQIKAFYELSELDLCQSLLQNLTQLLNRKGVLAYHKQIFKNTAKVFKQLLTHNHFDKQAKTKLLALINKINPLTEKAWFIEKVG